MEDEKLSDHPPTPSRVSIRDHFAVILINFILRTLGTPWLRCRIDAIMINGMARGLVPDEVTDELIRRRMRRYPPHLSRNI